MASSTYTGGFGRAPAGFRMPASMRLGRVRLQVSDLARSLTFYVEELGLTVSARENGAAMQAGERTADLTEGTDGPEGAQAILCAGDDGVPLVELEERPGAEPSSGKRRLGLYHFAILLPDRAALGRFAGRLLDRGTRIAASDHLVSEAFYLHDPDGHGIEVYADRPRAAWQTRGQELHMDTRPLDVADLVRAAGATPWTGLPSGTTIGHIHLHVGNLVDAKAFYHDGLGLDLTVWSYPGALFLSAGGYHHHVGVNTWAGAGARSPAPDETHLLNWEIVLPPSGVDAVVDHIQSAGFAPAAIDGEWLAADPWGTLVRVTPAAV